MLDFVGIGPDIDRAFPLTPIAASRTVVMHACELGKSEDRHFRRLALSHAYGRSAISVTLENAHSYTQHDGGKGDAYDEDDPRPRQVAIGGCVLHGRLRLICSGNFRLGLVFGTRRCRIGAIRLACSCIRIGF